jgi:ribonuclease PH
MDTNLSEIKDKFDELINSNKALLIAMKGDSTDAASFISNLISNKASNGATEQELQSYISTTLQPVFGSLLGSNFDWSNIKVSHDTNNNLILTVNGQSVSLSDANQNMIYQVLMKALEQAGIRG